MLTVGGPRSTNPGRTSADTWRSDADDQTGAQTSGRLLVVLLATLLLVAASGTVLAGKGDKGDKGERGGTGHREAAAEPRAPIATVTGDQVKMAQTKVARRVDPHRRRDGRPGAGRRLSRHWR